MRPITTSFVLLAVVIAAPVVATAQEVITHSSKCAPEGSSTYHVGDTITFEYHPERDPALGPVLRVPPCVDVDLEAGEVTGKPPLRLEWRTANGLVYAGRRVTVDTGLLPDGLQVVTFTATNDHGSASLNAALDVAVLDEAPTAPVANEAPSPDLEVTFTSTAVGAHEWRWAFGDGSGATGWMEHPCHHHRSTVTHVFPVAGEYEVTATARNCRDGQVTSAVFRVRVGDPDAITLTRFEAVGCGPVFCTFGRGELVRFAVEASASADRYLWDWDGDGTVDEVTSTVVGHRYGEFGVYSPVLTVERGEGVSRLGHERLLLVQ